MKHQIYGVIVQLMVISSSLAYGEGTLDFPVIGAAAWKKSEQLYQSYLTECQSIGLDEDTAYFQRKLATVYMELGKYEEALDQIQEALVLYGSLEGSLKTRLNIIDTRIMKGRILGFLRRFSEAGKELLEVFEENFSIRTESDPETVRLYKHLGWHLSRFTSEDVASEDPTILNFQLHSLAAHLGLSDEDLQHEEPISLTLFLSQKCFEKALLLDRKFLGETHPDIAKSYSLIGWILGYTKQYEKALQNHQIALSLRQKCYSENHPDIAKSYCNIAWNYEKLGNCKTALDYYNKALQIMNQVLQEGHPTLEQCRECQCKLQKYE